MAGRGFINDKLEIKYLILYISARIIEPVPFETMLDLVMCDEGVDYFDFSECLRDLVDSQHLTLSEEGLYAITEKGMRNSAFCEDSIAYSVRLRCDRNLEVWNRKLRRKRQVRASTEKRPNGTYTVHMSLDDDLGNLMDLQIMAVNGDMARVLAERFRATPEQLYSQIMQVLLKDAQDSSSGR